MKVLHPFTREILDALQANAAILDETGAVIEVNKRWRRYGRQNGATSDYLGVNYLAVCEGAARTGDRRAARVWKGLDRLLAGHTDHFGLAYPCGARTFRLRATRVHEAPIRLLIAHEDITALFRARRERDRAAERLTELRRDRSGLIGDHYEELGQRLAAITLAAHAIERTEGASAAVATIRMAVDEAKRELRLLRSWVEDDGEMAVEALRL
jgi:hypothetical protein